MNITDTEINTSHKEIVEGWARLGLFMLDNVGFSTVIW